jgi:hypothetical protein
MIPHEHEMAHNFASLWMDHDSHHHDHETSHGHHKKEHQHDHDSKSKKQQKSHYPFPFHQHFSSASDLFIKRPNLFESKTQCCSVSFSILTRFTQVINLDAPYLESYIAAIPPLIKSSFPNREAFALRGPPAFL